MDRTTRVATTCPRCGSGSIEIVYGLPDWHLFEASDRGEVELGGCLIEHDADHGVPTRRCTGIDCGIRFGGTPSITVLEGLDRD